MRDQPPPLPGMPSILDWLRSRLEDDHLADLRPGTAVAPADERQQASALLADLAPDHTPSLCHGDASSGNIISHGEHNWMFIDPRGMSGEHAYDVSVLAIRIGAVRALPDLLPRIADLTNVTIERLDAWMTVAHTARV
ncbi:aminoglycoside phosphotransferase family protein [Actinoplanes sp. CA-054009]